MPSQPPVQAVFVCKEGSFARLQHLLQTKELCNSDNLLYSWASACEVIDCRLPMIIAVCLHVLRHRSRWGSRPPSLGTGLHSQPEKLLSKNKDTQVSKYNYISIISCIIISKTHCKSGHIWVQLNQHMVTDLQKSGLITSRISTDIPWPSQDSPITQKRGILLSVASAEWCEVRTTVWVGWLMKSWQVEEKTPM